MEKARCNTELYSNLRAPLNNVKPSNFWGAHQMGQPLLFTILKAIVPVPSSIHDCNGTMVLRTIRVHQ